MGLKSSAYWCSWFITSLFFIIFTNTILVLAGDIMGMEYFTDTDPGITFVFFTIFSICMQFVGYFLSTVVATIKAGNSVTYLLFLLAMTIQVLLGTDLVTFFYIDSAEEWWGALLRWIFYFYPPFLLAKGFSDIAKKSGYAYDGKEFRWKLGPGYTYADLWKSNDGENLAKLKYKSPSTAFIMGLMLLNCVVYGFLTWYFDHVNSSNRG